MQSLKNKIIFITGASSGIGKACAEQCAQQGANLIVTARRLDRLQKLSDELVHAHDVKVLPIQLDVKDKTEVEKGIGALNQEWKNIDILVNNAGLALTTDKIQDAKLENWDAMIDTNLKGLLYVTRAILPNMVARNQGHIINIGSVAGRDYYAGGNIYCATKHAVKAISQCLRIDLLGTAIRVSEVAPGAVETEFSEVRWQDKERAKQFYAGFEALTAEDIADAVVYCATRRKEVNIGEITLFPLAQASAHYLYKQDTVAKTLFE
jgi:3-hydroxy acid dehydrogenase/malonic semialdehyde reductase